MALSVAQQIALDTGLPESVIQFLLNLSRPVRQAVRGFLTNMRGELTIAKASYVMKSRRYNGLSNRVQKLRAVTNEILRTNNAVLNALPLDILYKDASSNSTIKAMSDFMTDIVRSIPVKIPAPVVSLLSVNDLDFFEGVKSYKDLVDRIDSLEFRLARATSASKYAADGSFLIDQQLDKIDQYINAIDIIGV